MCDIRIASETATFAESFVRVGIVPGDGGAWLLPRAVGMAEAAEMAFTGDAIDAREALVCGLVSRVVAPEALLDTARALAQRIAANPGAVMRMTKRLLREGQQASLESLLEMSAGYQSIAHKMADHREAVMAFVEKRAARFGWGNNKPFAVTGCESSARRITARRYNWAVASGDKIGVRLAGWVWLMQIVSYC